MRATAPSGACRRSRLIDEFQDLTTRPTLLLVRLVARGQMGGRVRRR